MTFDFVLSCREFGSLLPALILRTWLFPLSSLPPSTQLIYIVCTMKKPTGEGKFRFYVEEDPTFGRLARSVSISLNFFILFHFSPGLAAEAE